MGMHIICFGTIGDGFTFVGPFATCDEALEWADRELDCEWWACPLAAQSEHETLGSNAAYDSQSEHETLGSNAAYDSQGNLRAG